MSCFALLVLSKKAVTTDEFSAVSDSTIRLNGANV